MCGDGSVNQSFEQCDDGNVIDYDGCSSTCQTETRTGPDPRRNDPPVCGDGTLQRGEQCDDRNTVSGDGCSAECRLESGTTPQCGDAILTIGETCDYGPANSNEPNFCRTDCSAPVCGDGILDDRMGEACDDGNTLNGDGCNAKCELGPRLVASAGVCGNGVLDVGEECDDSNGRDDDGCSRNCLLEVGICGDGIVQELLGERCEQATHDTSLPYDCVRCQFVSKTCGDGTVDPGEECDKGAANADSPDAACRTNCTISRCGDGILDSAEQCDDGGRINGDGCDRYCRTESTQVAGQQTREVGDRPQPQVGGQFMQFPFSPTGQPLPYSLPLAQLQPLVQSQGPVGDTGPAAVAVIGAGAAGGFSWMRRRKRNQRK